MKQWLTVRNGFGVISLCLFIRSAGAIRSEGAVNVEAAVISLLLFILTICIFSPWLSEYFAGPFTRFIDSIYYGNNDRVRPPLNLKRADYYRTHGSFKKAIAEYKRQLRHHPNSPDLWGGLIDTAEESGNTALAVRFKRQAFRRLKGGDRIVLERGITRR